MLGDSIRRRASQRATRPRTRPGSRKAWLLGVPLALVLPFVIGYFLAVKVLFPPPPITSAGIIVPDLVGRDAIEAGRIITAAGLGSLEPTELPHPSAPAGQVIAQSPLPGQQLRSGAPVLVAVSGGKPRAAVPDVTGFSAERATTMLQRSGFEVSQATQESDMPMGRVIRTDPPAGQVREVPSTITIVVSVPLQTDTIPVDTVVSDLAPVSRIDSGAYQSAPFSQLDQSPITPFARPVYFNRWGKRPAAEVMSVRMR